MEKRQHPLKGERAYDYNPRKMDDYINKGYFSFVFRCIRIQDGQIFAIKISKNPLFMLSDDEKQDLFEEINLMKNFPHPFIVKIIDDFIDSEDRQCIV